MKTQSERFAERLWETLQARATATGKDAKRIVMLERKVLLEAAEEVFDDFTDAGLGERLGVGQD